jgi:RNA polymerase sigma-70 factor (ECF subfamily)
MRPGQSDQVNLAGVHYRCTPTADHGPRSPACQRDQARSSTCRARVGGQEKTFASADDVAQEVCLAVLTALPSYRDQGRPFLAFVYGIASHKVADAHRSSARNRSEPVPEVPDTSDQAEGPEAQAMQSEFAMRMMKLMETLPDKQREIFRLRVMVGLSAEETAEAVGSTPGAVRVAQHRALGRLRGVLAAEGVV